MWGREGGGGGGRLLQLSDIYYGPPKISTAAELAVRLEAGLRVSVCVCVHSVAEMDTAGSKNAQGDVSTLGAQAAC